MCFNTDEKHCIRGYVEGESGRMLCSDVWKIQSSGFPGSPALCSTAGVGMVEEPPKHRNRTGQSSTQNLPIL